MSAREAYQEVLSVLPEETLVNIVDSLASGEYERLEVEKMVRLAVRIRQISFSFENKKLDKQADKLAGCILTLNFHLQEHYELLSPGRSNLFQLYPKRKHEDKIKTEFGVKSWKSLKDEGVEKAREVKKEYEKLLKLYQTTFTKNDIGPRFPHKIPAGTRWADFIFIVNGEEDVVTVKVKQHEVTLSFVDIGLDDGRTGKPAIQWELFKLFAKHIGEIPATSSDARDNYKKQKQLLSEKLKGYFAMDTDPFEPYEGAYKTKFTVFLKE